MIRFSLVLIVVLAGAGCASQSTSSSTKEAAAPTPAQVLVEQLPTPTPSSVPAPQPSPPAPPTSSPESPTSLWNSAEVTMLHSLWLGSLPPLPPDPSNDFADDPQAAELGHKFFFDTRFSSNGQVSCATCHKPELMFTDGLPLAQGVGTATRKTMTIVGVAYSPWFFWDGRKDSQWSQPLAPLENPVEHGGNRTQYAHLITEDEAYRPAYEAIFGPLPDLSDPARFPASAGPVFDPEAKTAWEAMQPEDREAVNRIYANMGKAIAAYGRLIMPGPSPFDAYVQAVLADDPKTMATALTPDQVAGLRLFIGKAQCTNCHNGPLLTDNDFHSTGVPLSPELPLLDDGRALGVQQVLLDEFNCLSPYSDAEPDECTALRFIKTSGVQVLGGFKPPTLRNVAETGPYMHAGQFKTLAEVLQHYNEPPAGEFSRHQELRYLYLSATELAQLEAFLHSLSGPLATPPELLEPPDS